MSVDNLYAAKLSEVFDQTRTFHELERLLVSLRIRRAAGGNLAEMSSREIIAEQAITPVPFNDDDREHGRSILRKVEQYREGTEFPPLSRGICLEDGAGPGYFVVGLAERFKHVVVLDLSLAYLVLVRKIVEENTLTNVTLICASAEHLPLADGSIDFVHNNNVIEHVTRQDLMLSEMRRVLSRDGLAFILSPNRNSLYFEPHFRLPGYGLFPAPLSRWIIRRWQNRDIDDIKLLTLSQLKGHIHHVFGPNSAISFLPRKMTKTVNGGFIRRSVTWLLASPIIGKFADFALNRQILGIMPYHAVLASRGSVTDRNSASRPTYLTPEKKISPHLTRPKS